MTAWLAVLATAGPLVALIGYLLFFPEKAELASALLWKLLSKVPIVFKTAKRRYVKHDLQGRLRDFTRKLRDVAPFLADAKPRIEWVDPNVTREAFLKDDKVVLRLRRDDPEDKNFVHGSYLFVSNHLLPRAKRYISPSHRESLDLFVTGKLIEDERPHVVGFYLDEYVHPRTRNPDGKIGNYFDAYQHMDEAGVFFGVMMQELDFLGLKVFGKRQDDKIIIDVNNMIEFLDTFALRQVGDDKGENDLLGSYCRFAIVIVGKQHNIAAGARPWIGFIEGDLIPKGVENIYLLGLHENREVLDAVASGVGHTFDVHLTKSQGAQLHYGEEKRSKRQYLVVLRKRDVGLFQAT